MVLWGTCVPSGAFLSVRGPADLAERARDRRDPEAEKQATHVLDELLAIVEATPLARPGLSVEDDPLWTAYRAVVAAETGRCRDSAGQALAWESAVSSCSAIGYRWYEAMARWRWAQALLGEGATKSEVARQLRQAHSAALDMGAEPLAKETESLARAARINLADPRGQPCRPKGSQPWQC